MKLEYSVIQGFFMMHPYKLILADVLFAKKEIL